MKRIISLILAVSLLLAFIPANVSAAEGEVFTIDFGTYDKSTAAQPDTTKNAWYMKSTTVGTNWALDVANTTCKTYYAGTASAPRLQANVTIARRDRTDGISGNGSLAIKFTAPKSGVYDVSVDVYEYISAGYGDVHLIDGTNRIYLGSFASHRASTPYAEVNKKMLSVTLEGNKEYSLAFTPTEKIGDSGSNIYIYRTNFTPTDSSASVILTATADKTALVVGDTAKATASAALSNGGMYKLGTAGGEVTYESLNINVAITAPENTVFDDTKAFTTVTNKVVVSNGNAITYTGYDSEIISVSDTGLITALAKGNTEVTVSAILGGLEKTAKVSVSVEKKAPGEAIEDTTVKFGAFADEGGTVTDENEVKNVEIGESVTVEATPDEGYEFAYWRNASGKHLSSSAKETFTVNTNTSVIAVFDKVEVSEEDTTVPVYLYNENGAFIEKRDAEKGSKFSDAVGEFKPTLTGFNFDKWSISGDTVVNSILRAVALYTADTTKYTVKVGENVVANGAYGDKVTVTGSDNFKAWKLEDNIVSYDKEYSFYIWGDITLTEVTEGETEVVPTVAINNIGDNYFIAYNVPAGYTLIEAGIVFADTGTPEVGSFYSKAVAKKGTGQFTAKKGDGKETAARGYVMFRDTDGSLRVIYSK